MMTKSRLKVSRKGKKTVLCEMGLSFSRKNQPDSSSGTNAEQKAESNPLDSNTQGQTTGDCTLRPDRSDESDNSSQDLRQIVQQLQGAVQALTEKLATLEVGQTTKSHTHRLVMMNSECQTDLDLTDGAAQDRLNHSMLADRETQTDTGDFPRLFSTVVKSGAIVQTQKQKAVPELQIRTPKANDHDVISSNDEKSKKTSQGTKETNRPRPSVRDQKTEQPLPQVMLIHDSVAKQIDSTRLGDAYSFQASAQRASTTEDIVCTAEASTHSLITPPDAIVIHCGLNDVKRDADAASSCFIEAINDLREEHSASFIIISQIAPVRDKELNIKRALFNAKVQSSLFGLSNVSVVSHENLPTNSQYLHRDGVHPTKRGAGILAGNVGRHVRNLFWTRPKRSFKQRGRPTRSSWKPSW